MRRAFRVGLKMAASLATLLLVFAVAAVLVLSSGFAAISVALFSTGFVPA